MGAPPVSKAASAAKGESGATILTGSPGRHSEPDGTKQAVLDMKPMLDEAGIIEQDAALRQGAAGQAFYNFSKFTLHDLRARAKRSLSQQTASRRVSQLPPMLVQDASAGRGA